MPSGPKTLLSSLRNAEPVKNRVPCRKLPLDVLKVCTEATFFAKRRCRWRVGGTWWTSATPGRALATLTLCLRKLYSYVPLPHNSTTIVSDLPGQCAVMLACGLRAGLRSKLCFDTPQLCPQTACQAWQARPGRPWEVWATLCCLVL